MRYQGIERRKKLKDEMKMFPLMVKIHRGEKVEEADRKRAGKKNNSKP